MLSCTGRSCAKRSKGQGGALIAPDRLLDGLLTEGQGGPLIGPDRLLDGLKLLALGAPKRRHVLLLGWGTDGVQTELNRRLTDSVSLRYAYPLSLPFAMGSTVCTLTRFHMRDFFFVCTKKNWQRPEGLSNNYFPPRCTVCRAN